MFLPKLFGPSVMPPKGLNYTVQGIPYQTLNYKNALMHCGKILQIYSASSIDPRCRLEGHLWSRPSSFASLNKQPSMPLNWGEL